MEKENINMFKNKYKQINIDKKTQVDKNIDRASKKEIGRQKNESRQIAKYMKIHKQ